MPSLWSRPFGPSVFGGAGGNMQPALNVGVGAIAAPYPSILPAAVYTTEAVFPHPQNPQAAYVLPLPPYGGDAISFDLIASGYATNLSGSASVVTFRLYLGTSLTVAANTFLATFGAVTIALAGQSSPFELHAHMIYDSVSGKLHGYAEAMLNNNLAARTAVTPATGMRDSNNPVANFVVSLQTSLANSTFASLRNFTVG